MGYGEYPAAYNPKVHGPYDPARFYGKGKHERLAEILQGRVLRTKGNEYWDKFRLLPRSADGIPADTKLFFYWMNTPQISVTLPKRTP